MMIRIKFWVQTLKLGDYCLLNNRFHNYMFTKRTQ